MRAPAAIVLVVAAVTSTAADAQTYAPGYPVCMQVYGGSFSSGYIECSYSTMEQCRASASGRPATCTENPYAAQAGKDLGKPAQSRARSRR